MSRRKTYRGQPIDMESLRQLGEKSIAMGNMGVNAKGDKLGPGGKIIQTAQQRTRAHYTAPQESSKNVSIKNDNSKEEIFPDEKFTKTKVSDSVIPKPKPKKTKKVEKETKSGDIIIEEVEVDED